MEEVSETDISANKSRRLRDFLSSAKSNVFTLKFLKIFIGGQFLSLLICTTAVTSQLLTEDFDVYVPTTQSFLNYVLLGSIYGSRLAFRSCAPEFLKWRSWKYFFLAFVDVEANFLVVKAYRYTTLISIQLLDCAATPVVLVLSCIFLKVRYKAIHFAGVFICLTGVVCLVGADILTGRSQGNATNKALGDLICLAGSMMYGVSNVGQEYAVRQYDRTELLGMVGIWGSLVSGTQVLILERQVLSAITWNYKIVLLMLGFLACQFQIYSLMPVIMKLSSATVVNLSILTADLYSLFFGLFLFHYKYNILFFVAFVVIMSGLLVYALASPPHAHSLQLQTDHNGYKPLHEDDGNISDSNYIDNSDSNEPNPAHVEVNSPSASDNLYQTTAINSH